MSIKPSFSIVIPLYNKYEFVERTLDSVLSQSYPNFEVIVVDDGSTDGSAEIVADISDIRINLIKQDNAGVSAARNRGIIESKYELIAFLDADDWWDKDYLMAMQRLILRYPNCSMFASKYTIANSKKSILPIKFFDNEKSDFAFDLITLGAQSKAGQLPLHTSSIIVEKSLLKKSGNFDTRISFYEDYDFFLRASIHSKVAYLNTKSLSFYSDDIPPEKRLTGKVPPLEDHLIYYIDKFEKYAEENKKLKEFLDKFILFSLLAYRKSNHLQKERKKIRSKVNIKNYSWKYLVVYNTPVMCMDFFKELNIAVNKLFRE